MTASLESASTEPRAPVDMRQHVLISGANWLGDSVMSAPAIEAVKRHRPDLALTVLVKSGLIPLWRMHPDVESVVELRETLPGALMTASKIRTGEFERALVFPHSFRSALIPFLAGIPERVGLSGHHRDWMLTRVVRINEDVRGRHQSFEYLSVAGMDEMERPGPPRFVVSDETTARCRKRLEAKLKDRVGMPIVGIVPGAAYGPSKRWPAARFAQVGRRLQSDNACAVIVLGGMSDKPVCSETAVGMGSTVPDFSGTTTIQEFAAMLAMCNVVIANDSGGMHLAAAMGAKVVAIFGITDPEITGPLGDGHRVITSEDPDRRRELARDSERAARALHSIAPDTVIQAACDLLQWKRDSFPIPVDGRDISLDR